MQRHIFPAAVCLLMGFTGATAIAQPSTQKDKTTLAAPEEAVQKNATYRVGLKSISVPPPSGLEETGSDFRVLFERLAPDSNRLVAAFVPEADIAKFPTGPEGGLTRYALLETLRQDEFSEIDDTFFAQAKELVAKQFGTTPDAAVWDIKTGQDELNHKLKVQGSTAEVSLDKPVTLGVFFSKPEAIGFGALMNVNSGGTTQKMVLGMSFLRARNRILYAFVYTRYTGDESVAWVRTTSEQWTNAILKANPK